MVNAMSDRSVRLANRHLNKEMNIARARQIKEQRAARRNNWRRDSETKEQYFSNSMQQRFLRWVEVKIHMD